MKTSHIFLLCILGAALVSTVLCQSGPQPKECCFSFYTRRVNKKLIKSYYVTDRQCPKPAIILVTEKSHLCVAPNLPGVQGIMKTLDEQTL